MKMPHATGAATEESMEDAKIYEAVGGDWGDIAKDAEELGEEHIVVNLGPVHPPPTASCACR